MRKLFFIISLLLTMVAMAAPKGDDGLTGRDSGKQHAAAVTLSIDGQEAASLSQWYNIVDWQTRVTLTQEESTASAQADDDPITSTPTDATVSRLAHFTWPLAKPETTNLRNDYTSYYAPELAADDYFAVSRAEQ